MMEEAGAQGHAVLAPTAAAHPVPSTPSKSVAPHHVVQDLVRKIIAGVREAAVLPKAEDVLANSVEWSLLVLPKRFFLRRWIAVLVNWKLFEWFALAAILANCITLAMDSNKPGFETSSLGQALHVCDLVFLGFFTVEALLKVLAAGLVLGPHTYLRNGWNLLDIVVITTGYLAFSSFGNYTAIRGVRALRPLRTITRIQELRTIVLTLLKSLPMLLDVFYLACFHMAVFGAATIQIFAGKLRGRCGAPDFSNATFEPNTGIVSGVSYIVPSSESGDVCAGPMDYTITWTLGFNNATNSTDYMVLGDVDPGYSYVRWCPYSPGSDNPYGLYCTDYGNPGVDAGDPSKGFRDFDNILYAWLTLFQYMTNTDWTANMYDLWDGANWWTWPLCIMMNVIGSWVLVNLVLAVLYLKYTMDRNSQSPSPEDPDATVHGSPDGPPKAVVEGIPEPVKANGTAAKDINSTAAPILGIGPFPEQLEQVQKEDVVLSELLSTPLSPVVVERGWWSNLRAMCATITTATWFEYLNMTIVLLNAIALGLNWWAMPPWLDTTTSYVNYTFTVYFAIEITIRLLGLGFTMFFSESINWFDLAVTMGCIVDMAFDLAPGVTSQFRGTLTSLRLLRLFRLARYWTSLERLLAVMMNSIASVSYLVLLLLLFMFITGLLGLQLFGYKLVFCDQVEGSYQSCPPGADCPDHWDCWIPCDPANATQWIPVDGSPYGGNAYCEMFPRDFDPNATDNDPSWPVYLAQVGKPTVPRANFDDIFQAFISIFQLLTLDNWADVMHNTMQAISPWYAIYYVLVIILGWMIVLQLFLAILLENLDAMRDDTGAQSSLLQLATSMLQSGGSIVRSTFSRTQASLAATAKKLSFNRARHSEAGQQSQHRNLDSQGSQPPSATIALTSSGPVVSPHASSRPLGEGYEQGFTSYHPMHGYWTGADGAVGADAEAITTSQHRASRASWRLLKMLRAAPGQGPVDGPSYWEALQPGVVARVQLPHRPHPASVPMHNTWVVSSGGAGPVAEGNESNRGAAGGGGQAEGSHSHGPLTLSTTKSGPLQPLGARPVGSPLTAVQRHSSLQERVITASAPSVTLPTPPVLGESQDSAVHAASGASRALTAPSAPSSRKQRQMPEDPFLQESQKPPFPGRGMSDGMDTPMHNAGHQPRDTSSHGVTFDASAHDPSPSHATGTPLFSGSTPGGHDDDDDKLPIGRKPSLLVESRINSVAAMRTFARQYKITDGLEGRSLMCMSPSSPFRLAVAQLVAHRNFDRIMTVLILGSSICLTMDTVNLDPTSQQWQILRGFDVLFVASFCVEAIMKIITLGFVFNGRNSYLRSAWNALDLFVALIGIVVLVVESCTDTHNLFWLRALRALRGLRLVRAAMKWEGIRVVVTAIFKVMPALLNVVAVGLLFYFMFAVMFTILLLGKMFYCADGSGTQLDAYYVTTNGNNINRTWCELPLGSVITVNTSWYHDSIGVTVPDWNVTPSWTKGFRRFDNVMSSIWVCFEMASLESWSDVMYSGSDAVAFGEQPIRNYNRPISLLFILFIMVGCFFMLNLIIGVSIDKFHQMKAQASGNSPLLTNEQQQWLTIQKLLAATHVAPKYRPPSHPVRRYIFKFVFSSWVDGLMMLVIILNIITMFLVHYNQGLDWDNAISAANAAFTGIFLIEMLLKWAAIGIPAYFKDGWNCFDGAIVTISVLGVLLDYLSTSNVTFLPLLRIFRIVRIFKLIPKAKGLRQVLQTLLWSLPSVANVASVLFLFMYIWAVIGMNLFGNIKQTTTGITRHANFESFVTAMITEFRMLTGENWDDIMESAMVKENCIQVSEDVNVTSPLNNSIVLIPAGTYLDPRDDSDTIDLINAINSDWLDDQCTPNSGLAVFYFCAFMLFCAYLLQQLIIAILLDNIQTTSIMDSLVITGDMISAFIAAWEELDPYGTCYISVTDLTALLLNTPYPLGVQGQERAAVKVQEIIMSVDIPYRDKGVHFLETLHALAGRVAGAELPSEEEYQVHHTLVKKLPRNEAMPKYTAAHMYAAIAVRSAVRGFMQRHLLKEKFGSQEETSYSEDTDAVQQARSSANMGGNSSGMSSLHGTSPRHHQRMSSGLVSSSVSSQSGMELVNSQGQPVAQFVQPLSDRLATNLGHNTGAAGVAEGHARGHHRLEGILENAAEEPAIMASGLSTAEVAQAHALRSQLAESLAATKEPPSERPSAATRLAPLKPLSSHGGTSTPERTGALGAQKAVLPPVKGGSRLPSTAGTASPAAQGIHSLLTPANPSPPPSGSQVVTPPGVISSPPASSNGVEVPGAGGGEAGGSGLPLTGQLPSTSAAPSQRNSSSGYAAGIPAPGRLAPLNRGPTSTSGAAGPSQNSPRMGQQRPPPPA